MANKKRTSEEIQAQKRADWLRTGTRRIRSAIKAIQVLGICGDRRRYKYTDEEVEKMQEAVDEAVQEMLEKYGEPVKAEPVLFTFDGPEADQGEEIDASFDMVDEDGEADPR